MNLKEQLKEFDLHIKLKDVEENDKEDKLVEIFQEIAQKILSGHFLVKNKKDEKLYVKIHPTCIEIYCHEEDGDIKDPIVYHRNYHEGNWEKQVFPLGLLHNHISGIDITFEKGDNNNAIRLSALIREFKVDDNHNGSKYEHYEGMYKPKNSKWNKGDIINKPTYLYEALYSQFSIFDGFSIEWVDGEKLLPVISNERVNVAEYEFMDEKYQKNKM